MRKVILIAVLALGTFATSCTKENDDNAYQIEMDSPEKDKTRPPGGNGDG